MARLSKVQKAIAETERVQSLEYLRGILPPKTEVLTLMRHVSKSGMSRDIAVLVLIDGALRNITWDVAQATGEPCIDSRGYTAIRISGVGTDAGFQLVYHLGYFLYPNGFAIPEGSDGPNGDTSGFEKDGGYALRHRWL